MLYACDAPWWDVWFPEVATGFAGELWTVSEVAREKYGLAWIFSQANDGLSQDPTTIHTGGNSGYQAISLAYLFGAARVLLLGFDFMLGPKGERHHHAEHPKKLGRGCHTFHHWIKRMDGLAADLARTNCKVFNATRRTALKCFPRVTLETALHEFRNTGRNRNP